MKKIAIVGGGACGVATFVDLVIKICANQLQSKTEIIWFEKDKKIGYGVAFGSDQKGHILNTQADLMGIFSEEPGHFSDWLKESGEIKNEEVLGEVAETSYTSRRFYGDYMALQAKTFLEKAQNCGLKVSLICEEVQKISVNKDTYLIKTKEGNKYESNLTVLGMGVPRPNNYDEFLGHPNYVDFPWPSDPILEKMGEAKAIGIIGCSLSAIDTVVTLVDNGYDKKIWMFSPDGLLPRVQPVENKPYKRTHLTLPKVHELQRNTLHRLWVKDIFRLFQQDVEQSVGKPLDWKSLNREGKDQLKLLKEDIEAAENGGDDLLNMTYCLRYDASEIWSELEADEKIKFMKWFGPHWGITRHGMPLQNAYKLRDLLESGQLEIISCMDRVTSEGKKNKFKVKQVNGIELDMDLLINATGSPGKLEEMDGELVKGMLKDELILPYPAGGALINKRTMEAIAPNRGPGLFVTGHLANGILMDVNAVWFNVRVIGTMNEEILMRLKYDCS